MNDDTTNESNSAAVAAPDELDALAAEVAADAPTPAPDAQPEPEIMPMAELIRPTLRMVFDKAAPAWRVSDAEVKGLADVYGALIDKYFPGGVGRWGLELSALMLTFAVLGPRWGTPTHEAPKEEARAA